MNHYQILNIIKKINIIIKNDYYIYNFLLNMCIRNLIFVSLLLFYDLSNANNIYYDENYNELHMNKTEYYDYLYNKYLEFNNTYNKYNFIENLKYHFNMKNINHYYNDNEKDNDFNFEHSFIATNEKDYKNHKLLYNLNKNYYVNINNLMTNYYNNMCNSHANLCGGGNNNLYYYPYFNAYNVNVFNYIFNRVYKSFVNFDVDEMINNVPNINEIAKNILIN
jgi:hypothetical protein